MPITQSSPARVPNLSYDTSPRDLFLLDSVVQRDMARTKRVVGCGGRAAPYAVGESQGDASVRVSKRVVHPKPSGDWQAKHVMTRRTNHLQNAPSSSAQGRKKMAASRVNDDHDPMLTRRRESGAGAKASVSRINEGSNIFGPATAAYKRAPPPRREPFAQREQSGHIRPTLPGQTDAGKFIPAQGTQFTQNSLR
eukprot:TRINITY_DN28546_c0_g1_i1.p1 TRINITY_DN28546_c0_g1~~TRINITY_DN28546_c0_g1_i1.p1  ORF type:complete len:195 (+),score=67.29 TRINITY_DN28546_c0_g1_i1:63-647(+)